MNTRFLKIILVLAALAVGTPAAAQTTRAPAAPAPAAARWLPEDEDLKLMLRYLVEDGETPGVVLGILEADGSTRVYTHGTAGAGTRPLGARTLFEIGSVNKTFTGALLAELAAQGRVALTDPVQKHLPASVRVPTRGGKEITLLDLATHYSGLTRIPDNHVPADRANPYADLTTDKVYAFLSGHTLRRDPGAEYEYSNVGMGLLGHALGRAAGMPFQDLLRTRITEPLGMRMTGYARPGEVNEWMAAGHNGERVVSYWDLQEVIAGAGGLRSNADDMLTYLKANLRPARTGIQRAMLAAHEPRRPLRAGQEIGLAWNVAQVDGRTILSHGGATAGFRTMIAFDPDRRIGFVMLANSGSFGDDLGLDFLRRGAPLALPVARVAPAVLAGYVGDYELVPGRVIAVRDDGGSLTIRMPGEVRFRMYPTSDTEFYLKRTLWRVRFNAEGLVVEANGERRSARRVR